MKKTTIAGLFIAMVIISEHATGQTEKQEDILNVPAQLTYPDHQIEKTAEVLDTQNDYYGFMDDLTDMASKPVNLNSAKEDDLNAVPFLTAVHRKNLFAYLTSFGEVLSLYELQSIPGFDSVLIQRIQPFISVSPVSNLPAPVPKNLVRFGHHTLLLRYAQAFPQASGYAEPDSVQGDNPSKGYPGSPQRYYFRYNYSWFDKIRIGVAGEKDPGEQIFKGAQPYGMDFYAAYLCLSNFGILKNLIIGNYKVSYGQGLTMGSGLSLGSVPGFTTNLTALNGIRPATAMSEGLYLRGLAATLKLKRVEISGFASYHPRDATIALIDSASQHIEEISSFSSTGYHRTGLELAKRNSVQELVCGGNINFSMAPNQQLGFKIGFSGVYYHYSATINPGYYPYNRYEFRGKYGLNTGLDFQVRYRGTYLFGEIARGRNGGLAWLTGLMSAPDTRVSVTLIVRNYPPEYQNIFSNAFGQNSLNANESGIYAAVNAAIHPKIDVSGYYDYFKFPWLKYRVDMPVSGQEFGTMLGWKISGNMAINLRFYQKNNQSNETSEPNRITHNIVNSHTRSYRLGIEWLPCNGLILKTRVEARESGNVSLHPALGVLIYQDAQIKTLKWPESLTMRFALFDIPDYNTRIYTYEPEVLYGYSVPAYQGRGMRACLLLKFRISGKADLWLRGGITSYSDRNTVGTGLDMTKGNIRGDLTGQLLIRF